MLNGRHAVGYGNAHLHRGIGLTRTRPCRALRHVHPEFTEFVTLPNNLVEQCGNGAPKVNPNATEANESNLKGIAPMTLCAPTLRFEVNTPE